MKIEELADLCIKNNLKIALAESCTGGAIAKKITTISGASQYFLGSIVCYSDEMKNNILGVDKTLIDTHTSVSKEVVQAMCKGVLDNTTCDYAMAISGYAGPLGEKVGLVYLAVARKDSIRVFLLEGLNGLERNALIEKCVDQSIQILCESIIEGEAVDVN